jgi:hypothetical protein
MVIDIHLWFSILSLIPFTCEKKHKPSARWARRGGVQLEVYMELKLRKDEKFGM